MDLSAWLLRHTPPRPLVVAMPGGTAARLAVERVIRVRGWQAATSPASANLLVVAGEALEPQVGRVWDAFPVPRARVDVIDPAAVADLLDAAVLTLRDVGHQREQAIRPMPAHHEHEMAGQHSHDMGDMEMPGGVPMADRADDRDGLKLDQLHVPLGPALPLWPAGLVVHTMLQGDVIQHATVEMLSTDSFWDGVPEPARRLDSSACLLDLAGWADAAAVARRLRDDALDGTLATSAFQTWARRVRRSRTLRWLLAGVGTAPDGDALTRLHAWLEPSAHETQWTVDALPGLLDGTELATARLIVADRKSVV